MNLPVLGQADDLLDLAGDVEEIEKKEKCGLFGVWGHAQAAGVAYQGLFAQQHRGQESAGIAVRRPDGELGGHAGMGLVSQVFKPRQLREDLAGHAAIGHVRYSTTGSSEVCNAQPILQKYHMGPVAIAHNGNLVNGNSLRRAYEEHGHIFQTATDTEIIVHLLARPSHAAKPDPLPYVLKHLQGAYALLFLFPDRLECVRDPWGIRPLSIGRLPEEQGGAYVAASETCAFDATGATFVRDVEPGEIVTLSDEGISSRRFDVAADPAARCVFEYVYFANPASVLWGRNVHLVRERLGRQLARESGVEADIVIPMPDSGRSAALGFAKQSGISFEEGIVPNRFVGRTFILPDQDSRDRAVALKLNIIEELVRDQRVIVVDDSIVRGTTTRSKMLALRKAGAKEIHLRISCPPIRHPCFYGIDFATKDELIAGHRTVEEIRDFLEVDSLAYLSQGGMLAECGIDERGACTACWSGHYKVPLDDRGHGGLPDRGQLRMFG